MPSVYYLEIKESLAMALNAIRVNKLRSFLTLLGIVVGVFSIILVMTAIGVLQNSIESGLSQFGVNTFQIEKYPALMGGSPTERLKYRNRKDITYEQGLVVKEKTSLAYVALGIGLDSKIIKYGNLETNPNVNIGGEDENSFQTNNWIVKDGRAFNSEDVSSVKNIVVLGSKVAEKLFPRENAVGKTVRVDGYPFTVIGVLEAKGNSLGGNSDNFVLIPITAFCARYGKNNRSIYIKVQAFSREVYDDAVEQVRGILRTIRKVDPGKDDDFEIYSNDSVIEQFNSFTKYVKLGVGFISFIALIAAGVGIMNIMLVSVTERTREIGIRKAIGAKKNNILIQFVLEAIVLCELGGLFGISIGIIGGNLLALWMGVPAIIPWDWVVIGLMVCSFVGIIFGTYPAWKAANLDPIEALRYE